MKINPPIKLTETESYFFDLVIRTAIGNGISINLHSEKYIQDGTSRISGSFDSGKKLFSCAVGGNSKRWFTVFLHESCHMDQYLEDSEIWNSRTLTGRDPGFNVFEWLDGKLELSKSELKESIKLIRELELDCEKRAVDKIVKYNLPIEVDDYIREANCYVLFYNFIRKHRLWYNPSHSIYRNKELLEKISPKFSYDYSILPMWYEELVIKNCFEGNLQKAKKKAEKIRQQYKRNNYV